MTERDRSQTHAVLDVAIAVEIPDMTAFAAHDEGRRLARELIVALGVSVGAARDQAVRQLSKAIAGGGWLLAHDRLPPTTALRTVKASAKPLRERHSSPRTRISARKFSSSNQVFACWLAKWRTT